MDGPPEPSPAVSAANFSHADGVEESGGMTASRAFAGMEGGDGEFSYTRNSILQSQAIDFLKPILKQEIGELNFDGWESGSTVRMADFGCSTGANTLQYAEICFQSVQECCRVKSTAARKPLVVQYYFCDLPSNDFNTLFRQLEDWRLPGAGKDGDRKNFYAAAVPGSFYKRLFPPGSLRVAISVFAVHWMSQVPDAVVDRASPAHNKGRVWISNIKNPVVVEAFAQAARLDLRNFLTARADEVVSGGLVVFYILGRADGSNAEEKDPGPFGEVFEATWEELVVEGIIDEEKGDSFNVPIYRHSVDEVRAVAESTNTYDIKRLEINRQICFPPNEVEDLLAAPEQYGQYVRNFAKAALNSTIVEHIGEKSTAEYFDRLERNAATLAREGRVPSLFIDCLLAVLVRK